MNNLGWYQKIVTVSKMVGGPKRLLALVFGGGIAVGAGLYAGGEAVWKRFTEGRKDKFDTVAAAVIYTVHTEGRSNEGLLFNVGDRFRVLAVDGDAGLIEKLGDQNSPYFVSIKFLALISDYEVEKI